MAGTGAAGSAGLGGMVRIVTLETNLNAVGLFGSIPCQQNGQPFDTCSIQTVTDGVSFGTGVLTVKKANEPSDGGVNVTGATSITTETVTELTGTNWFKAGFLQFHVTTAAGSSVPLRCIVRMARLGFSV